MAIATTMRPLVSLALPQKGAARLAAQFGLALGGTLLLTLSAKTKVVLGPVDMNLQTLAVLLIASAFGLRLGLATLLLYLAEGAAGLPVFQSTPEKGIGIAYMLGTTGGYLAGFVVMAAADEAELKHMVATSVAIDDRPSAFRYPRGEGVGVEMPAIGTPLEIGKGRILREGAKIAILSLGTRLAEALRAAEQLAALGLSATVADARFAKPLDEDLIARLAREHEVLITVEEGSAGGFGSHVLDFLARSGALDGTGRGSNLKVRPMAFPDVFIEQDKPEKMYDAARLNAPHIVETALAALGLQNEIAGLAASLARSAPQPA